MQVPRIDVKNVQGLVDKVVGLGKEIVGTVVSSDQLTRAGQVQQEKGSERIKAIRAELDARAHETKAAVAERAERGAQKTKEAVNS